MQFAYKATLVLVLIHFKLVLRAAALKLSSCCDLVQHVRLELSLI